MSGFVGRFDVAVQLLSIMTALIPLFSKEFDERDKPLSFVTVYIDDEIDVVLHVGADVAELAERVYGTPLLGGDFALKRLDFKIERAFVNAPEIPNHALQATAAKGGSGLRTEGEYFAGFFIILADCGRNVIRERLVYGLRMNERGKAVYFAFLSGQVDHTVTGVAAIEINL